METSTGLLIGGAVVAGGLLYLYVRRQAKDDAPKEKSKCDQVAEAAAALGGAQAGTAAKIACEIASRIELPELHHTFNNSKANGAATKHMHPALYAQGYYTERSNTAGGQYRSYSLRNVFGVGDLPPIEFSNGCVPYPGAPGWSKCAQPGTEAQAGGAGMFTGRVGNDPTTRAHLTSAQLDAQGAGGVLATGAKWLAYPVPVPAGHTAWWVAGNPLPKPDGAVLGVDHRTDPPTFTWVRQPTPPRDRGAFAVNDPHATPGGRDEDGRADHRDPNR